MAIYLKIIVLISGIMLLFISGYLLTAKKRVSIIGVSGFCLSSGIYCVSYAMELGSKTISDIITNVRIEFVGLVFVAFFASIMILEVLKLPKLVNNIIMAVNLIIALGGSVVVLFGDLVKLFINDMHVEIIDGVTIAKFTYNSLFHVYWSYSAAIFVIAIIANTVKALEAKGALREQNIYIFVAIVPPLLTSFLYYLGIAPYGVNMTPFAYAITGVMLIIAVFTDKILDVTNYIRDSVFDCMNMIVVVFDANNNIIDHNSGINRILGEVNTKVIGGNARDVFGKYPEILSLITQSHSNFKKESLISIRKGREGEDLPVEKTLLSSGFEQIEEFHEITTKLSNEENKNGIDFLNISKYLIYDKNRKLKCKYIIASDVTKETNYLSDLNYMASYDPMTGALNRSRFMELVQKTIDDQDVGTSISFMVLDLDYFKRINDEHGHPAGDEVLRSVSNTISRSISEKDIFGRLGGEEFAVFCYGITHEQSAIIAERIRRKIAKLVVEYEDIRISVSISIGMVLYDNTYELKVSELFEKADKALYKAKNTGRNKVVIHE